MADQTIIDNEYVTMWYYTDKKIVHHTFHKFLHGQPLRECLTRGIELFKKNSASKWLSDDRNNSALPKEDMEWAQTSWFPQVVAAGWKYWAIVLPEQIIGQLNMKRLIKQYSEAGVTAQIFSDPQKAMQWLENQ